MSAWWLPLVAAAELPEGAPIAARAFGNDLVVWRADAGAPAAVFEDRCPHRGARLKKAEGAAPSEVYALWCCPTDEESTRAWFTICTDDPAPGDATLREFQATIFGQDAPVLESQRPKKLPLAAPGTPGAELHCAADRLSVACRRWLAGTGATFGTC